MVFVDDFVGSGDQFRKTWQREYETPAGRASFATLAGAGAGPFYYCPLVCAEAGRKEIADHCTGVRLWPTHLLPPQYCANHPASLIWPDALRPRAQAFVEASSRRAGIPQHKAWGYGDLGLALAFSHGVPDSTLPILWWEENGWIPLVPRR